MSEDLRDPSADEPGTEYLWDRSAPPDPTVQAVEHLLARFALRDGTPLAWVPRRRRKGPVLVAVAALVVLGLTLWSLVRGWSATPVAPMGPRLVDLDRSDREIAPGTAVFADAAGLRLAVASRVKLLAAPGTRLRLLDLDESRMRIALDAGALEAAIDPAVGRDFLVVVANELSCVGHDGRFLLDAGEKSGGVDLVVEEGSATLRGTKRTAFVPAGARCRAELEGHVGTPMFRDADPQLIKLASAFDDSRFDAQRHADYADKFCGSILRARDTLALWHLLTDPDPRVVRAAEAALVRIAGVPPAAMRQKQIRDVDPQIWREHLAPSWR